MEVSNAQKIDVPLQEPRLDHVQSSFECPAYRVLIINGMAVVNSVIKNEKIKTCLNFLESFLAMICKITANYDEIRLVFDRYVPSSLKEQMRSKRTKGKSTYRHVKDTTIIQNVSLKDFLSDVRTKTELTEYLAEKVIRHSKSSNNKLKKSW